MTGVARRQRARQIISAQLTESSAVAELWPAGSDPRRERALVRVSRAQGKALAASIHAAAARRDAKKATEPIRIQVDPLDLI